MCIPFLRVWAAIYWLQYIYIQHCSRSWKKGFKIRVLATVCSLHKGGVVEPSIPYFCRGLMVKNVKCTLPDFVQNKLDPQSWHLLELCLLCFVLKFTMSILKLSSRVECDQWRSKDVRGPWTRDSPGPLPWYFKTLFLWHQSPPHTPLLRLYTRLSLLYDLNTALFNQYTSHVVFWKFRSLWWCDGENGGPWWRNDGTPW